MIITEPATMLTDYMIVLISTYIGVNLYKQARRVTNKPRLLFGIGFLTAALAALTGGTFHGFAAYFSESMSTALWNITVFFIGITGGIMVCGGIVADPKSLKHSIKWLVAGVVITLVGFGIQQSGIQIHRNFNHNDLFHLTQIGAFFFLYKLARNLEQDHGFNK